MDTYEKKYKESVEKLRYKITDNNGNIDYKEIVNVEELQDIFPELAETEEERIRKYIIGVLKDLWQTCSGIEYDSTKIEEAIAWIEKQGEQKPKKVSIWKHWKDGIAGGSEGEQIYLIKSGLRYSISSCLGYECDYIELSELDELLREEKQGGVSKLSEEEQNKFAKTVLTSCAFSFINYLDSNKYDGKMCVSNGECEDIENAFHNAIWDKLHRYYCKYIAKQGEQKPQGKTVFQAIKEEKVDNANRVEPKFKVGDWVVWYNCIYQVLDNNLTYVVIDTKGLESRYEHSTIDKVARYWTIKDAKDGDVLVYVTDQEDLWIMIYWSLYEPYEGHVHYHALLVNDNFSDKGTCCICIDNLKPAIKEQRDLLFYRMREAGWAWDAERKELVTLK